MKSSEVAPLIAAREGEHDEEWRAQLPTSCPSACNVRSRGASLPPWRDGVNFNATSMFVTGSPASPKRVNVVSRGERCNRPMSAIADRAPPPAHHVEHFHT